jgi:methyl-accepting chemotaxis protein
MIRAIALVLLMVALGGCRHGQTVAAGQSADTGTSSRSHERISLEQLLQEMIAYTSWHNARVKAIAARVEEEAPNEDVRYEALRLKARIIQTQRNLVLSGDPRDAFTDSWVYAVQRRNYLLAGGRNDVFLPWHDKVIMMSDDLEAELKRIGALFMTPQELAQSEAAVEAYANEHPTLGMFDAPDIGPSANARTGKAKGLDTILNVPLAPFSAIEGVDTGAAALSQVAQAADRLTALAVEMPEQIRWQAEIFDYNLLNREPLKTTFEDFHRVSESLDRVSRQVESLPEDVRTQVEDVFNELDSSSQNLQETLRQAKATADALTATADSADQLVQSAAKLMSDAGMTGEAAAPPKDPDAPSEVEQLTAVARETRSTVVEARGLVSDLDNLLKDSKTLDDRIRAVDQVADASVDHAAARVRGLIRFATLQGVLLIGVAFVAAIAYRIVATRIIKPR